ncbi:hypothetical protein ACSHWG_05425 [Leucobacter sp. Z1108]|uniref:hypothetical protein n=1 Tax=Leucobacter sp. Z1108 TaxID=3439066 RepID=UPI003F3DADD5
MGFTEIATVSGVERSTVYKHASSLTEFLIDILVDELAAVFERFRVEALEAPSYFSRVRGMRLLLETVLLRQEIYRQAGRDSNYSVLSRVLARHLHDRHLFLVEQGYFLLPESVSKDAIGSEMAAWFITDGVAGSIKAWIDTSANPDIDTFLRFHAVIPPEWWHSESDRLGRIR